MDSQKQKQLINLLNKVNIKIEKRKKGLKKLYQEKKNIYKELSKEIVEKKNNFIPKNQREEELLKKVTEMGGYILSPEHDYEKMFFKCKNGHIWNTRPYTILKGSWCRECKSIETGLKKKK